MPQEKKMSETEVQGGSPNLAEVVKHVAERSLNIVRFSDKLSESITKIDDYITQIARNNGVVFEGDVFLTTGDNPDNITHYSLGIKKLYVGDQFQQAKFDWGIVVISHDGYGDSGKFLFKASRQIKTIAVRHIPQFLQAYAKFLQEKELEFKEVSETAERMANAISS
jgi:hypothetical protein